MKLKQLKSLLQDLEGFQKPKVELEQYITPPELAGEIVFNAHAMNDIAGKTVCDLGCGTGMLTIAALLMDAKKVFAVDADADALRIAKECNFDQFEFDDDDDSSSGGSGAQEEETEQEAAHEKLQVFNMTVSEFLEQNRNRLPLCDTVIMNPPFGTRCKGADMEFLEVAIQLASTTVYSLHKTSTRDYVVQRAAKWNATAEVMAQLKYNIDESYQFHKKKSVDVEVDLIRFTIHKQQQQQPTTSSSGVESL